MNEDQAWKIINFNIPQLVSCMVTVQKGAQVDVYCDPSGHNFAFSKPSGEASMKLCSVTAPDLAGCYGVYPQGDSFVTGDGEAIPKDQLARWLAESITQMKNEGAEWGWEFKVSDA